MRGRALVVGVVLFAAACTTEDPRAQDGPPDPAPAPGVRGYDAERDVVVMTGGLVQPGSTERHQDVWEWSGDSDAPAVGVSRSS